MSQYHRALTHRPHTAGSPASSAPLREMRYDPSRHMSPLDRAVRGVLTHPFVMALKVPLKDALWTARGRRVTNPPIPRDVRSMLFVCKGNICRSPFAAYRAARLLADSGSPISCASAGIETTQAERSPRDACDAAGEFGVRLDDHRPVQLTRSLVSQFSLILVMEASQLASLRRSYPEAADRILLLSLLDNQYGYARYHIPDPFGRPRTVFDACYRRIDYTLRALLRAVAAPGDTDHA